MNGSLQIYENADCVKGFIFYCFTDKKNTHTTLLFVISMTSYLKFYKIQEIKFLPNFIKYLL